MHKWHPAAVALALLTLAWPLIVYLSLGRFEPRWLALLLLALALLRLALKRSAMTWGLAAAALLVAAVSWIGNAWLPLKLYPVGISLLLLALFGASLRYPPSMVERFARLAEPGLPDAAIPYTRRVTQVWCLFFCSNALVSLGTTLWGSDALWTLYNGLLSYLLMGSLMGAEWLVRRRVRARIAAAAS